MIICIVCIYVLCNTLFFSHIDNNLQKRWAVLPRKISVVSYKLGRSGICLSVLINSRTSSITATAIVLWRNIFFSFSISNYLYLLILSCSCADTFSSVGTIISVWRYVSFIVFNNYIWSIAIFFLTAWIAKSHRIVALFASVIGSVWCLYHFSQSNISYYYYYYYLRFQTLKIYSNEKQRWRKELGKMLSNQPAGNI